MSAGSEAVLYDIFGDPMAVEADTAIPTGTAILIGGGSDGTNARYIKVDSSGNQVMIGLGTAGSPAGGVVSIQGVGSGTPIPVSGTVTAINPSVGSNDSAIPTSSTLIGGSDGTNLRSLRIFDLDSGGGQQWVLGVGLRKSAGGGSVELGTSSDPIRTDPTGTTTQPVSGTVTANQGGSWTVAATQSGTWTVQPGNTANTTPWLATINQGGNSATVTASNALKVDGSAVTQPVSGTVTVTQSTASNLRAQLASETTTGTAVPSTAVMIGGSDGTNLRAFFVDSSGRQIIIGAAANGAAVTGNPVLIAGSDGTNARSIRTATDGTVRVDPTGTTTQPISGTVTANQGGAPWSANITQFGGVNISTGTGASGTGIPRVTVANDSNILATQSGTWTVQQGTPPWSVVGPGATGAALSGNPVRIAGSDGTNTRNITTDTSGRLLVSGAAADGTAVTGNPVLIGGQDGINVQSIATDGYGRVQVAITGSSGTQVEGRAADGAAPVGNPVYIAGYDGANIQSILTDTQGRIVIAPSGASTSSGFSFGEVVLSALTVAPIRSTTYTEPSVGAQRSMASSSANDTAAGTGARTVRITYYTLSAGTVAGPFTEIVTLNGTANVNTVATNICYIEELEVVTTGSGGANAGTITLFGATAGGGGTVWTITVGANRTFGAHHYVPSSKTCNITTFNGGIKGADTTGLILRAKDPTNANSTEIQITDTLRAPSSGNTPIRTYGTPIKISGPARITAFAVPDSTSSRTYYASFDFYEE